MTIIDIRIADDKQTPAVLFVIEGIVYTWRFFALLNHKEFSYKIPLLSMGGRCLERVELVQ